MTQPSVTTEYEALRFQAGVLEAVEQSVIVTDLNWIIIYWNRFAETVYGWSSAEALGRHIGELLVLDASAADGLKIMACLQRGHSWSGEFVVRRRDGTSFTCLSTNSPLHDTSGVLVGVVGVSSDITARKQAEAAQARLAAIVTSSEDAIIAKSLDGTITDWNRGAEALYGYTAEEIIGQPVSRLMPLDRAAEATEFLACAAGGHSLEHVETVRLHKDGRRLDMSVSVTPIRAVGGAIVGAATIGHDITRRKRTDAALAHQLLHDGLTGLPNRGLLHARLRQALAAEEPEGGRVALLLLDLDRFKEVNDTLGHQVGDVLLQQIGQRLQSAVRAADLVARLGGDEFAVLLSGTDATGAAQVADALVRVLQAPFVLEEQSIIVDASIGIAVAPDHGGDADALLRCADVAMYQAKRSGMGVARYSAEQDDHRPNRLALLGELRHAIDNDELLLYYQPKLDLRDGSLVGVEALVRWQHPQRGLLSPDEFIPVAEQTGLIYPLSHWVLEAAIRQQQAWRTVGMNIPVAVNLSRRTLHDPQLPHMVSELLTRWEVLPSALSLEITESSLMADPVRAGENLSQLHALGVHMSIDDFGTGYSSLASLKNLPIDELKIDQSFVRAMATDASSRAIVRAIIDLADALKLRVVAEGVEDRATWDVLAGLGCEIAQGYFLSRPIGPAELETWVAEVSQSWLEIAARPRVEDPLQERIRGRGARLTAEEEFIARKRAEAALFTSEERNRLALEAAGMGTWDWDVINDVTSWSTEMEAIHGLGPGTFEGTFAAFQRTIHPDDWPAFQIEMKASKIERRNSIATYRAIWPDGSVHWVENKGRAIYAADGTVLRVNGTSMDITERKHAEAALSASEERFRLQYMNFPLPTLSWLRVGDDFVLQDMNLAAEAASDGQSGNWRGRTAAEMYPDQPEVLADLVRCAAENRPLRREVVHQSHTTGRVRELVLSYACVPPRTVMIHIEDVTQARQAQAQADEERATLAAVMGSMTDGLIVLSGAPGAGLLFANARAAELVGVQQEGLSAMTVAMLAVTENGLENPGVAMAAWEDARLHLDARPSFAATVRGSPPRKLLVQLFQIPSASGVDGRVGILLRDVSAEQELLRTKDELVSVVSHELRAPLAAVLGFAELVRDREYSEPQRRKFLNVVIDGGRRLTARINDFSICSAWRAMNKRSVAWLRLHCGRLSNRR